MILGAAIGLPLNIAAENGSVDATWVRGLASVGQEIGGLFLRLLKMLVVPLIISSLITGVTGMGNLKQLGALGRRTVAFYMGTSAIAITTGILCVNILQPGVGADLGLLTAGAAGEKLPEVADASKSVWEVLFNQLKLMIPTNPLKAAADGDMLPVIFFSLLLGVFINAAEHDDTPDDGDAEVKAGATMLKDFFHNLFAVMMRMTLFVIKLAPIGVFGFMLYAAAGKGFSVFQALGMYALTVAIALAVHAFITLPLILKVFGRRAPWAHAQAMTPALLTAFSTASSNGTLPLTMKAVESSGVNNKISSFVLPLGATINMDGTALYEAVAVLFIAQAYGMDLSLGQQVIVAATALLASIGAAGIPHAGTVMMVVVLSAVGLPSTAVGLILAVDRILDMCRTTVNVWSDSCAAVVVQARSTEFDGAPETADAGAS